jgi:hypothetical protein
VEDAGTELQALEADMAVEPDDGYEPSFGDDQPLADPGESEAIVPALSALRAGGNPLG